MREFWGPGLLLKEGRILGIQYAYSKKMFFHSGKPQSSANTFFFQFTAPQEGLSSLRWAGTTLPSRGLGLRGSPRPPQLLGSIPSSSPVAPLLCLSTSLFLLIPKCRHCCFPCSPKGHDLIVVASSGSYFKEQRNRFVIRHHACETHHSGPFTGVLLSCLPSPLDSGPDLPPPLPASSQGETVSCLDLPNSPQRTQALTLLCRTFPS